MESSHSVIAHRPTYHFLAPHSWMNDPCGAVYIPEIKSYILAYQWHPGNTFPGASSWGLTRSFDLLTWTDMSPAISLGDSGSCDSKGVFSGSIVSKMVDGKRVLYLFYTSVSAFPIHWSKPYVKECESQSLAWSVDLGNTWHKNVQNPVLSKPRHGDQTTGWRDPFVSIWPSLSALRKANLETNYMLISSGKRDAGPELMLYESADLIDWSPCSVLFKAKADSPVCSSSSSLFHGRNFECASFFSLGGKDFIACGEETAPGAPRHSSSNHKNRYTLWMCGRLRLDANSRPVFIPVAHGTLDHGILYAPHIFRGAKNELLLSGWADEDLSLPSSEAGGSAGEEFMKAQGWAGCLTLPRELYIQTQPLVDDDSSMPDRHSWIIDYPSGMMTTLGIRPARHLRGLRSSSMMYPMAAISSLSSANYEIGLGLPAAATAEASRLVFNVRSSPDGRENTKIIVDLTKSTVSVDRSKSSLQHGNSTEERGVFPVLPNEGLQVRIFVDASIVEININDRFCLTSRIYPSLPDSLGASCELIARNGACLDTNDVWFQCWEGLLDACPERVGGEGLGLEDSLSEMSIDAESGEEFEEGEDGEFDSLDEADDMLEDMQRDLERSADLGMVHLKA